MNTASCSVARPSNSPRTFLRRVVDPPPVALWIAVIAASTSPSVVSLAGRSALDAVDGRVADTDTPLTRDTGQKAHADRDLVHLEVREEVGEDCDLPGAGIVPATCLEVATRSTSSVMAATTRCCRQP